MHRVWLAAIAAAAALFPGPAAADGLDARDILRQAETLVRSLIDGPPPEREIIHPPGNIDPRMALTPPPGGTLRLLAPPDRFRQE